MSDNPEQTTDDTRTVENDAAVAGSDQTVAAPERENSIEAPPAPAVAVPEASSVGDDAISPDSSVEVTVNSEPVAAQVTGAPAVPVEEVRVHETFVQTDRVITDTSDPLAVQIPDAGRGSLDLPIHALGTGTVEEHFAKVASKPDKS